MTVSNFKLSRKKRKGTITNSPVEFRKALMTLKECHLARVHWDYNTCALVPAAGIVKQTLLSKRVAGIMEKC